jgi:DnaJ-class molecular chaperone
MEKNFAKLNYYEMLDVKPEAAFFEIRHAYNTALQMYQSGSLVSHSFFSQKEREEILALIEKAYLTLVNEKERKNYDNELIRLGILKTTGRKVTAKKPTSIFDINRQRDRADMLKNDNAELKAKIAQNQRIREILSQQEISGTDFKTIRNELGVAIEKIARETKIRIDCLNSIEENNIERLPAAVFLKGFIKSYLKCLCIEPADDICTLYMNGLAGIGKNHESGVS